MADNAFVKIGMALFKHQVKKLVGEEALGAIGEELAGIGGDKLDAWLGDQSTRDEIEKAARIARDNFRGKVNDDEVEQWMAMLPIDNLPDVLSAINELPTSPDESKLEDALRQSIALNWRRLSTAQVENAVNAFMFCLRSALLPVEKHTLTVIGRAVLRTEDGVNKLLRWFEEYIIAGKFGTAATPAPERKQKISLAKLPSTDPTLFGRDEYLKQLDEAWMSGASVIASEAKQSPRGKEEIASTEEHRLAMTKVNVLSLVAWGGVGKTALVNKWLLQMGRDNYRGAERVYGWSFYSQGAAEGRQVSADQFIAAALTWFGDPDPTQGSPWDKGERLAELIKAQRTLLILDGLEPLQSPPPVETGKIKDPGLTSLLRELARQNPGLVVISTRLAVDDLKDFKDSTAKEIDLDSLTDESGAAYLKYLGVDGTDEERQQASHEFGGHALALTLLGRYLKVVHNGDIRKRGEIPHVMDEQKQGAHARRVMESYERWLQGKPELDILRLMGLFDRPAEKGALDELREAPAIEGLTDTLQNLNEANWKFTVNNLRELRLLAPEDSHEPDELDCHPLLREHFGEKLKAQNIKAWREAHGRLYEYYKSAAKEQPDTLEEMAPLYAAVIHGGQAEKYQQAFDDVYRKRIHRNQQYFNLKKLGASGADLAVLSVFFRQPWRYPIETLREDSKALALATASFNLQALGRLIDAIQPAQASLDAALFQENWHNAPRAASTISQLYKTIGNLTQALNYANQAIRYADSTNGKDVEFERMFTRADCADCLFQMGHMIEARGKFIEAEEIQAKIHPNSPLLYSLQGFLYCNFLLDENEAQEVLRRAMQTLARNKNWYSLLDVAVDNLSLGRALLITRIHAERVAPIQNPFEYLNRAIEFLRQSGYQDDIPRGLLARAEYYRLTGDLVKAQKDVDEAFTIAARGGMGLHLADCHLEYSRLKVSGWKVEGSKVDSNYLIDARKHLATAKEMINRMGYHRRDKEVQELEEILKT